MSIFEKEKESENMVPIEVPVNVTHVALEIYQNLPECSMNLKCLSWNYGDRNPSEFRFEFLDYEEEENYEIDLKKAEKGIKILMEKTLKGEYYFYGCETIEDMSDLGNWDAEVVDAAVQCAIFGEVIYG